VRRLWRVVRGQAGYSLIELLVTMIILGTILGGLTTAFVQGSNAELEANRRVQAQLQAAAAFDRLRRDIHCASAASAASASPTITLTGCGSGSVSWCALGSGSRYTLYRQPGSTCDSTGKLYADYLTSPGLFTYTAPVAAASLAKVHVDVVVNVNPTKAVDSFDLQDDIVMRNSVRA
jgi:prepilin-type N-terminal cleavage/methylation domain-containing protein